MSPTTDLFPGFSEQMIDGAGARIFCRIGGDGPPLLLIHGFPSTHVMWHRVAPALAEQFTTVLVDLRGYGRSDAPADDLYGYTGIAPGDAHTEVWRRWAANVRGAPVDSGHFVTEENPQATLDALLPFLAGG